MDIVTIDFETYYDKEFSLSKMTTEQYIRDPRFEVIGVGIKVNDHPTDWYSGSDPGRFLRSMKYDNKAILCHHTAFDGAILSWKFGIDPKLWLDTLSMAKPAHAVTVGGSLASLAAFYNLGAKGSEVINALGKRREDFTKEELARYAEYCVNDVELTYKLYKKLRKGFPATELLVIDQTIRMFTHPTIELDVPMLAQHLRNVQDSKTELLRQAVLGNSDAWPTHKELSDTLMSNDKFAAALEGLGIDPPTKISPRTGLTAFAFAKTDYGMQLLQEHPDERVQALANARLGIKSTIEETRTEALIGVANRGRLPIMLNYFGAHTGRFSGGDKLNLQNLPKRGNNTIRRALKAPEGHVLVACDSAQIEARVVAWLAGQESLLEAFRDGRDVYSEFATEVYGRKITRTDKVERFVGKTCIAEGTLVLSHHGWKPIESVTTDDLLWDGWEWVCHQGLLNNGIKPTLNLCGAWLTPDHQIWSGTQWSEAQSVVADEDTLYQALDTGAENLPSQATLLAPEVGSVRLWSGATAAKPSTGLTTITSKISKALAALYAPREHQLQNAIGCTAKQWRMITTGLAYSIVSLQRSLAATLHPAGHISTTVSAAYGCAPSGALNERSFCGTSKLSAAGTTRLSRWIGSMWTGIMNRGISASYRGAITSTTSARLQTLKRVYDILNSGSRNRFTILTEAGPLIVHNCILGLGYGMGAEKFRRTLEIGQGGVSVNIDIEEAQRIVRVYRSVNHKIPQLWNQCSNALGGILHRAEGSICDKVRYTEEGVHLPNGFVLKYPALRASTSSYEYIGDSRNFKKFLKQRVTQGNEEITYTKIYGGKMTENIVQALAAQIIREQMAAVAAKGLRVVLQVHDEIVVSTPEKQAKETLDIMLTQMSQPPRWAPDLPLACEGGYASNYGDT